MSSLRARVLVSVLALAAAGLVIMAVVTYAEQRTFLIERVDGEARDAVPALSQLLDSEGFRPAANAPEQGEGSRQPGAPSPQSGRPRGPGVNLPPGTYGQRRAADGRVLHDTLIKYSSSEAEAPEPRIPAVIPLEKPFTVGSVGSSQQYRAYEIRDPEDSGLTVVAIPLRDVDQTLDRLLLVEGLVIAGVLAALGLSAFFVVKIGLRPLDRIEHTAGQIAAGDLSKRVSPATSRTEVGRLGLALNAMLDRLEQAFAARAASEERLRQFLADASHELRTPLASIRGYAELFRMGATAGGEDTELAMRRIEEESKRMGVLVEDLLTLARLDETRERRREAVDVAALARDAVQDARATAPERPIELSAPERAVVAGEELQLRQVLANLLRNTLVHTPAGTPVEVSVADGEREVTIGVRDHGAGLPAGSTEKLFDRFWRTQHGRERGKAGAGLGLSIVRRRGGGAPRADHRRERSRRRRAVHRAPAEGARGAAPGAGRELALSLSGTSEVAVRFA